MHNMLANKVLRMGNIIYCEKMGYKGLQKQSLEKELDIRLQVRF